MFCFPFILGLRAPCATRRAAICGNVIVCLTNEMKRWGGNLNRITDRQPARPAAICYVIRNTTARAPKFITLSATCFGKSLPVNSYLGLRWFQMISDCVDTLIFFIGRQR